MRTMCVPGEMEGFIGFELQPQCSPQRGQPSRHSHVQPRASRVVRSAASSHRAAAASIGHSAPTARGRSARREPTGACGSPARECGASGPASSRAALHPRSGRAAYARCTLAEHRPLAQGSAGSCANMGPCL
eukprot:scaffold32292_cov71-Phaeocystis_antarctica.AAC.6